MLACLQAPSLTASNIKYLHSEQPQNRPVIRRQLPSLTALPQNIFRPGTTAGSNPHMSGLAQGAFGSSARSPLHLLHSWHGYPQCLRGALIVLLSDNCSRPGLTWCKCAFPNVTIVTHRMCLSQGVSLILTALAMRLCVAD